MLFKRSSITIGFSLFALISLQVVAKGIGFLWASNPSSTAVYTPSEAYAFNSLSQPMSIERLGMGQYKVVFNGLGSISEGGGNLMVTAYGDIQSHCQPNRWETSTGNFIGFINCFSLQGTPLDSAFTATVHYPNRIGFSYAYAWAGQPNTPSYIADVAYAYNPASASVSIKLISVGEYQVIFTNMAASMRTFGGNVQVNGYGPTMAKCAPSSWQKSEGSLIVNVRCRNGANQLANSKFVTYVTWPGDHLPLTQGYLYLETPTPGTDHVPPANYSLGTGNTVNRLAQGSYKLTFGPAESYQLPPLSSTVQVTAYNSDASCKVRFWNDHRADRAQKIDAFIDCYSRDGHKVDSKFSALTFYPYIVP